VPVSRSEAELLPLGLLERAGLRKIATDCGFDLLEDAARWVAATSTQAPLLAWLGFTQSGPVMGLSMPSVLAALGPISAASLDAQRPPAAGWLALPDMSTLDSVLMQAWRLSRALPNQLEERFAHQLSALSSTDREATIRQRVGQDLFREGLMTLWRGRCAISGLAVPQLLRASHAKPWAASTDAERLDVFNGLLLAAHLDAAFDAGLITIQEDGSVGVSSLLPDQAISVLQLGTDVRVPLSPQHLQYLAWHRSFVFRP